MVQHNSKGGAWEITPYRKALARCLCCDVRASPLRYYAQLTKTSCLRHGTGPEAGIWEITPEKHPATALASSLGRKTPYPFL